MLISLSNVWEAVKGWFKYSETILLARFQVFFGFIIAAVSNVDWTALSDFASYKQSMWLAIGLVLNGIMTEIARRRNADI